MAYEYELLPPLVQDVLKPFTDSYIKTNLVKFYFTIGNAFSLNSEINGNIRTIQIMIQQQNTSNEAYYSPQYELIDVNTKTVHSAYPIQPGDHFIQIPNSIKHFPTVGFYKIKMRWSKKTISYFNTNGIIDEDFSEWSKVSLIKQIYTPYLHISSPFVDNNEDENEIKQISFSPYKISGYIESPDKSEILKSINIIIKDLSTNKIIIHSGEIIPCRTRFSYILTKELQQSINYEMEINYELQSGFSGTAIKKFVSISRGANNNPATITLSPIHQRGKMQVIILIPTYERYEGNFIIRRANSNNKFSEWEDIKIIQFISQGDNKNTTQCEINGIFYDVYTWEDKTVSCGIYYKYGIAPLKQGGWRGNFIKTPHSQACFFDDIYLMGNNKQLCIKFDPIISNYKQNFSENLQTTLGSQYPFITRNGANNYKSFTFGGLITTYMDTYNNHSVDLYNDSLGTNRVNQASLVFIGKTDYFGRLIDPLTNSIYYDLYDNPIFISQVSYDDEGFLTYSNGSRIFNKIDGTPFKMYDNIKFLSKSVMQQFQAFDDTEDEIKDFTSKEQLFNGGYIYEEDEEESPKEKLEIYNQEYDIDQYEDVIYEKAFRDKVLNFLYQNSVKLFRSSTEGTMLIRLMNISLTPKQELGRMLYSFTADAIEIDEYSIVNCDKYNIQNIGHYETIKHIETVAGTLTSSFFYGKLKKDYDEKIRKYVNFNKDGTAEINILQLIKDKYKENWKYQPCVPTSQQQLKEIKAFHDMYDFTEEAFKFLKIEICSPPNLIVNNSYWIPELESTPNPNYEKRAIRGYLLKLDYKEDNSKTIIIKSYLQRKDAYISPTFANEVSNQYENYSLTPDNYNPGDGLQARDNKFIYVGAYVFQQVDKLEKLSILLPQKNISSFITINLDYTIELNINRYDSIPIQSNIKPNVGQLIKTFIPNQDIIEAIKNKYYFYLGNSILNKNIAIDSNIKKYESLNIDASKYQLISNGQNNSEIVYINSYNTIMQKINNNKLNISSILTTLREMFNILAISFDTEINAVIDIETTNYLGSPNQASKKHRHILNTGYLKLSDLNNNMEGIYITNCQFKGLYLSPTSKVANNKVVTVEDINKYSYYPRPGEYIFVSKPSQLNNEEIINPYSSKEEIENLGHLIENGVYIINNESTIHYNEQINNTLIVDSNVINNNTLVASSIPNNSSWIWHKGKWYPFNTEDPGLVECPVDAIVNYIYEGGVTTYQLVES